MGLALNQMLYLTPPDRDEPFPPRILFRRVQARYASTTGWDRSARYRHLGLDGQEARHCSIADILGSHRTEVKAYASTYHGDHEGRSAPRKISRTMPSVAMSRATVPSRCTAGPTAMSSARLPLSCCSASGLATRWRFLCRRRQLPQDFRRCAARRPRLRQGRVLLVRGSPTAIRASLPMPTASLRQMIKTPLLIGEHVRGLEQKYDFAANDGTDFVRVNPDYDLGITGAMKVAHMDSPRWASMSKCIRASPAHRHCVAAFRNTNYYELGLVGRSRTPIAQPSTRATTATTSRPWTPRAMSTCRRAGLGVVYDWDRIQATKVEEHVFELVALPLQPSRRRRPWAGAAPPSLRV